MMETDEYLRKILRENAMERAPEDLIKRVLEAVEADPVALSPKEPLISKRGWVGISLGILSLCIIALLPNSFFEQFTTNPITGMQWLQVFQWEGLRLPQFSKTTLIGTMAFAIFGLFHIFWMKQHLSRSYK
jgi:hypothetical protein